MNKPISNLKNIATVLLAIIPCLLPLSPVSAAQKLNVVVSIRPLHSLVAGVMQGAGQPHLLIDRGTPHSYALKPSNARALQNADLVFWVGPSLEQFLISPLKSLASKALNVPFEKIRWMTLHKVRTNSHHKNLEQGAQHIDPHFWLDPDHARTIIIEIAAKLSQKDPPNKYLYWQNSWEMIKRISKITEKILTKLGPLQDIPYVTLHDAFLYFEKRFKLTYAGSIALTPDHQPGARHLRDLRQRIKKQKISCVFSEQNSRSKLIDLLIEGSNAKTASLDVLGNGLEKGPELYFTLLQNNARAFFVCLRP